MNMRKKNHQVLKKILLIHTGGTIGMEVNSFHELKSFAKPLSLQHAFVRFLRKQVPELWSLANLDVIQLMNKDSAMMHPKDWIALYQLIISVYERYDGFVITHGTDTMAHTGTALSFLLPQNDKPIIFTGSQRPLQALLSDARQNLTISVGLAVRDWIYEVSIFFDTLLLQANRTQKVHIEDFRAFDSPNYPYLAQVGFKTAFNKIDRAERNPPSLKAHFDTRVQVVYSHPGIEVELQQTAKAVIILTYGLGTLPLYSKGSLLRLLRTCLKRKIPAILCAQIPRGSLVPQTYGSGKVALELGAISAKDMNFTSTLIKCFLLLGNDISYQEWGNYIHRNWAGEVG